jgi:hypothetical protein
MNRATAMGLTGCLIVLVVYVFITASTLVRDLDAARAAELYSAGTVAQGSTPSSPSDSLLNGNKPETADIQKSSHKHHIRTVSHRAGKPRLKQDPLTLLL